jgi:hypothetical protein
MATRGADPAGREGGIRRPAPRKSMQRLQKLRPCRRVEQGSQSTRRHETQIPMPGTPGWFTQSTVVLADASRVPGQRCGGRSGPARRDVLACRKAVLPVLAARGGALLALQPPYSHSMVAGGLLETS